MWLALGKQLLYILYISLAHVRHSHCLQGLIAFQIPEVYNKKQQTEPAMELSSLMIPPIPFSHYIWCIQRTCESSLVSQPSLPHHTSHLRISNHIGIHLNTNIIPSHHPLWHCHPKCILSLRYCNQRRLHPFKRHCNKNAKRFMSSCLIFMWYIKRTIIPPRRLVHSKTKPQLREKRIWKE